MCVCDIMRLHETMCGLFRALFRATEVILATSCPSAPRIGRWLYSAMRGDSDALHEHSREMSRVVSRIWREAPARLALFGHSDDGEAVGQSGGASDDLNNPRTGGSRKDN